MSELRTICVGMLTHDLGGAGTNSRIALSINDVQLTYPDTGQEDQERGKANLYSTDVAGMGIMTEDLNNSAIRVLILGGDQWAPEQFVVWAKAVDGTILPLAIESNIVKKLSTEPGEGNALLPLRLVGGDAATFTRLLFMMVTENTYGTNDLITLTVRNTAGVHVADYTIPKTTQDDLVAGAANLYFVPVDIPFERADLGRITVSTNGYDDWMPREMYIFGLDGAGIARPTFLAPLVHIDSWKLGRLSTNTTTGQQTVSVPSLPLN